MHIVDLISEADYGHPKYNPACTGFTLIELSIVLVIIGLIIGGVLVGQDLIKAAQIRATIQQVERYNTEVRTFQTKYNAIPGDIQAQAASSFGMSGAYLLNGNQGDGDGNGLVEDGQLGTGGSNDNLFAGEISEFWAQLSWSNLIDGGFGTGLTTGTGVPPAITAASLSRYLPPAKLGRGMTFTIYADTKYNYYGMFPIASISTGGVYNLNTTGLDPITASNIDTKIDDGSPLSGIVLGFPIAPPTAPYGGSTPDGISPGPYWMGPPIPGFCVYVTTAFFYNLDAKSGGNDPTCAMSFRMN